MLNVCLFYEGGLYFCELIVVKYCDLGYFELIEYI